MTCWRATFWLATCNYRKRSIFIRWYDFVKQSSVVGRPVTRDQSGLSHLAHQGLGADGDGALHLDGFRRNIYDFGGCKYAGCSVERHRNRYPIVSHLFARPELPQDKALNQGQGQQSGQTARPKRSCIRHAISLVFCTTASRQHHGCKALGRSHPS